tara:strand:- start:279 stop:482 length:204 start_codon:yes stop_codon:yes gene_type:complete
MLKNTGRKKLAKKTPLMFFLSLSVLTACLSACGQKGALYLPQDNANSNAVAVDSSITSKAALKKSTD